MTLSERDLRTLVAHLPDYVVLVDREGRHAWVNRIDPTLREEDVIGAPVADFVDPAHRELARAALGRCLREREPGEYEVLGYGEGEHATWYRSRVVPLPPEEDGSPRAMLIASDVTEARRAERALAHSEARFRSLLESLPQFVALIDRQRRIRYLNHQPPADTGRTRESVVGVPIEMMVREREAAIALCETCFESGQPRTIDVTSASGARRQRAQIVPMPPDARGELQAVVIVTDVTEESRGQEQRELLIAELDHRVKNTLATVMAVAEQTLARAASLDGFRETFLGRIRSLARTHEALAASRWRGVDLADLVHLALGPFSDGPSPLESDGANPSLPPAIVTPLATALHELCTNAAKYGALSPRGGTLAIRSSYEDGALVLVWEERGVAPSGVAREGLGLRLVRNLVEHEIGGRLTISIEPDGRTVRIVVPLGERRP